MPSPGSSGSKFSREAILEDALFLLPRHEDFPLVRREHAWSQREALTFVLQDLLEIKDDQVLSVISTRYPTITRLYYAPEAEIRALEIDPDDFINDILTEKIIIFQKFYSYLDQFKFPGLV
jgi:hypothetical protein